MLPLKLLPKQLLHVSKLLSGIGLLDREGCKSDSVERVKIPDYLLSTHV